MGHWHFATTSIKLHLFLPDRPHLKSMWPVRKKYKKRGFNLTKFLAIFQFLTGGLPAKINAASHSSVNTSRRQALQPPPGLILASSSLGCVSPAAGRAVQRRNLLVKSQCVTGTLSSEVFNTHLTGGYVGPPSTLYLYDV